MRDNNLSYPELVKVLEGKSLDIAVIIHEDRDIHFSIVDTNCHEEILVIGQLIVSVIKGLQDNHLQEAIVANAIATIIFDKLLGDNEKNNPVRAKGAFWFDEETKRLCRV